MRLNKDWPIYVRLMVAGLLVLVGVLTIIASAEQMIWVKPGAGNKDFNRDNYACLKESQARVSESYYDRRSGGSSSSTVQTNQTIYNACMYARGWTLQEDPSTTWEGIKEKTEKERKEKEKKARAKKATREDS
jgi:hypothetical protein